MLNEHEEIQDALQYLVTLSHKFRHVTKTVARDQRRKIAGVERPSKLDGRIVRLGKRYDVIE